MIDEERQIEINEYQLTKDDTSHLHLVIVKKMYEIGEEVRRRNRFYDLQDAFFHFTVDDLEHLRPTYNTLPSEILHAYIEHLQIQKSRHLNSIDVLRQFFERELNLRGELFAEKVIENSNSD